MTRMAPQVDIETDGTRRCDTSRENTAPLMVKRTLRRVGVMGVGSYVPERVLRNTELAQLVDTSDDWIISRTGMRDRRIAAPGDATSDLVVRAAKRALENARLLPREVELILVATVTPDHVCPPTACLVQHKLGAVNAAGFDISAACSGFINALMTGHNLVGSGAFGNALVVGADILSSITDYEDRESCILFGDGAGAVVIGPDTESGELLDHVVRVDGAGSDMIIMPAGGSRRPASHETVAQREHYLSIQGRKVFRFAVEKFCEVVDCVLERNGFTLDDVGLLIPHQANLRIIEAAVKKLGIDMDRVLVNVDRYGNTSSASIPIALDEAVRTGRIEPRMLVGMLAFGGGLTWGASLMRW